MDINELKSNIPHGYGKKIAERAGVSTSSVAKYMTGKTKSHRIEMAMLEVMAELNTKKKILLSEI